MKQPETYFHEALGDEDYRAVGRVLVTFAHLEHALVSAGIAISGALDGTDSDAKRAISDGVKKTFSGRCKYFSDAYRKAYGDDRWVRDFEDEMRHAIKLRDHFAHGQWDKVTDSKLKVQFFARDAIEAGLPCRVMEMSLSDLDALSERNKKTVKLLHDRFPPDCLFTSKD